LQTFINHIGTAVPNNRIAQSQVSDFMANAHGTVNGSEVKLRALYRATGIQTRYSVISDYNGPDRSFFPATIDLEPFPDTQSRMDLYKKEAIHLASNAIRDGLGTNYDWSSITDLITVSCTGFYAPGIDFDIISAFNMNRSVSRTAVNYMGCYAAISALRVAHGLVAANPDAKVLIVCVELCSIHFQKEHTEDNVMANALFGDGAAAMLVEGKPSGLAFEILRFESRILPNSEQEMAWNIGNLGFEMKLSAYVPDLIKKGMDELLTSYDAEDFSHFAIHPGGKKILKAVEDRLGIGKEENHHAHQVLKSFGNMSSPTILFVLQSIKQKITLANKGEHVLGVAFGPGLTIESFELKVSD
jgi:predicted naringenin-chalcone synthase